MDRSVDPTPDLVGVLQSYFDSLSAVGRRWTSGAVHDIDLFAAAQWLSRTLLLWRSKSISEAGKVTLQATPMKKRPPETQDASLNNKATGEI